MLGDVGGNREINLEEKEQSSDRGDKERGKVRQSQTEPERTSQHKKGKKDTKRIKKKREYNMNL